MCNKSSETRREALTRRKAEVSLTLGDVLQSKQAHPGVPVHRPFLGFTVRLAAVVHEASLVPFGSSVNDPILEERRKKFRCDEWTNMSIKKRL